MSNTRVDFYEVELRLQQAVCERAATLRDEGERVYVWAPTQGEAQGLDELLWTFADDAFVPHGLWSGQGECDEPIAVGWAGLIPDSATAVLIAGDHPLEALIEMAGRCPRLVDLVPKRDQKAVGSARVRYKALKDAGLHPHFHKLQQ